MKRVLSVLLIAVLASVLGCSRQRASSATGGQLNSADRDFVTDAAKGGKAEVELGNLAAEKATHPDVKQFAQKMVNDHSDANNKLQQVAQQKNIRLPDTLPDQESTFRDQLSKMSGAEFDRTYMQHMVQDHQKDVSEFQREANNAQDPDVKTFASSTLPTLQQHLELAQTTENKVRK